MRELFTRFGAWVADLPEEERDFLFARTAAGFYRI